MKYSMQSLRPLCVQILFALAIAATAQAADVKIIVNSSVGISNLSADDLKSIFLLTKKSFADGTHAEPVLAKGVIHMAFLKQFLGKSEDSLTTYYRNAVFTGKGLTPRSFASDAEVAAYVAKTKGAIGYVSSATTAAGIKPINVE